MYTKILFDFFFFFFFFFFFYKTLISEVLSIPNPVKRHNLFAVLSGVWSSLVKFIIFLISTFISLSHYSVLLDKSKSLAKHMTKFGDNGHERRRQKLNPINGHSENILTLNWIFVWMKVKFCQWLLWLLVFQKLCKSDLYSTVMILHLIHCKVITTHKGEPIYSQGTDSCYDLSIIKIGIERGMFCTHNAVQSNNPPPLFFFWGGGGKGRNCWFFYIMHLIHISHFV